MSSVEYHVDLEAATQQIDDHTLLGVTGSTIFSDQDT
jgi:hypothetical protein